MWRPDGEELYYLGSDGLYAVPVETEGTFRHDTPVRLFDAEVTEIGDGYHHYDITPDGKRFLMLQPVEKGREGDGKVTLLQRWRALLE